MGDCETSYSSFAYFTSSSNGGIISISQDIKLIATFCIFRSCKVSGNLVGGSIYFHSTKDLIACDLCAYECVACNGYFLYSSSSSTSPYTIINRTMTSNCSGSERAVCYILKQSLLSREYNSSYCTSVIHNNVHSFYNLNTNCSFYHFFKNKQDIIYGANSPGSNHLISYICLISNGETTSSLGYIHINSYADEILSVDRLFVYNNTKKTIFAPYNGIIKVLSFQGNSFLSTGAGKLEGSFPIDTNFVFTTIKKKKLDCMYLEKAKCTRMSQHTTQFRFANAAIILLLMS